MKALGVPIGISILFWSLIGILRAIQETFFTSKNKEQSIFKKSDIAVLIPAHNEELVIRKCIQSVKQCLHRYQIYVASDGSMDKTHRRARMEGVHTSNIMPGKGKARAIIHLINRFKIKDKYKLIFILDADTFVDKTFIDRALQLFSDKDVGVVFAGVKIHWPKSWIPSRKLYFISYRERLNKILKYLLTFGQTWKYTNVNYVIPGFCTIYRLDVFEKLNYDAPGLLVEDFNMAFELNKKKIAKIAHNCDLIAWDQHPDNLKDYWKQVKRWNIGFFQTVKRNGFWPSLFWISMAVFTIEVFMNSLFTLFIPFILIMVIGEKYFQQIPFLSDIILTYNKYGAYQNFSVLDFFILIFLIDYLVSVFIGVLFKKPQLIFYGLFFYFMHFITSLILLSSIIPGFLKTSDGRWISPSRRIDG